MKGEKEFLEILLSKGIVDKPALEKAEELSRKIGVPLLRILYEKGLIDRKRFLEEFSRFYKIPYMENPELEKIPEILPFKFLRMRNVIPMLVENRRIKLGIGNPFDIETIKDIEFITGMQVEAILIPPDSIEEFLKKNIPDEDLDILNQIGSLEIEVKEKIEKEDLNVIDLKNLAFQPPIVRLVNMIIVDAVRKGATDLHIEPQKSAVYVRLRIDGLLHDYLKLPSKLAPSIVSRIKIMGKMDIAERRKPQDGGVTLVIDKNEVDLRISVLPSLYGEKVVIRVLDKSRVKIDVHTLGFNKENLNVLLTSLKKPHGVILVTGPTGSGKTTTLYAALNYMKSPEKNIITVEDPVEYTLEGITQVQVKTEAGLTFASALRSILRQDPDIILVGEIRDRETAEIAMHASLTGHLVLSTLHTNDALGSIFRLKSMGVESAILADTVVCVEAQRLVRKVCPYCGEEFEVLPEELEKYGVMATKPVKIMKGKGCNRCNGTGYKGRTVVEEVIPVDDFLRDAILKDMPRSEILKNLYAKGFKPIKIIGIEKVLNGITTFEELSRVVDISGVEITDGKPALMGTEHVHQEIKDKAQLIPSTDTTETPSEETGVLNILVIDDSPTIRAMLKPVLEMDGHNVLEAENGRAGIEVLKKNRVHLIILDLMMPEMDGFETLKVIKNHPNWKKIPVIMLTTKSELENELKGFDLGVDDFMPKPFLPERLLARVRALLKRYYT